MRFLSIVFLIILLIDRDGISCSSPPPPVKCRRNDSIDCTVTNAYGIFPDRATCRARAVVFPSSEEEVLEAVAKGSNKKQKMRVVTRWSHSIPKLVCAGGDSGLIISTRELKRIVKVDEASMTITVESGASLREVIDAAADHSLALPHSPYWEGLTIGGLLSTGAHGSSLFDKGSAVHEYVVGIRLAVPSPPGYAIVVSFNASHPDLNAAKVSLGLLGVISQVSYSILSYFYVMRFGVFESDYVMRFGVFESDY